MRVQAGHEATSYPGAFAAHGEEGELAALEVYEGDGTIYGEGCGELLTEELP